MSFFPDPGTILVVGGIYIRWYAVTLIIGCVVGYLYSSGIMKTHGYKQSTTDDMLVIYIICALLGGRIVWVLENYSSYRLYLWNALRISDGGFDSLGSMMGIALGIWPYGRKHHMSYRRTMDVVMPALLLVFIITDIGRSLRNFQTFAVVGLEILAFFIVNYYVRPYKSGRRRGDTAAITIMLTSMIHLGAMIFGIDKLASNCAVISAVSMAFGLCLYIYSRYHAPVRPVILFDFDGTIMDSQGMVMGSYAYIFQKYDALDQFTKDIQKEIFEHPLHEELHKLFPERDTDRLVREYREFQKSLPGRHLVQTIPHVSETIKELSDKGYILGIVTSRLSESCEAWLEDLEIEDYFQVVVGTERYRHAKPAPDGIIRTCEMLERGHDNTIYIGDNVSDVEAGKNAGVYTIAFVTDTDKKEALEDADPNKVITDIRELTGILDEPHAWSNELI